MKLRFLFFTLALLTSGIYPHNCCNIIEAAQQGDAERFFQYLKKNDLVLYSKDYEDRNLLHHAAQGGNIRIIKFLVEVEKFDVNAIAAASNGPFSRSPIQIAAMHGNTEAFFYLVEKGAVLTIEGKEGRDDLETTWSLLFYAAKGGCQKIIRYLLDIGLNINKTNEARETPLSTAIVNGKLDATKLLIERNANLYAIDYDDGILPFSTFRHSNHKRNFEIFKLLAKKGNFDLSSSTDYFGDTLLQKAAEHGNADIFFFLIDKNVTVENVNDFERNMLRSAVLGGNPKIITFLTEQAELNKKNNETDNKNLTALVNIAACEGHFEAFNYLLSKGAVLPESLYIRLQNLNPDIIERLIKKRLNLKIDIWLEDLSIYLYKEKEANLCEKEDFSGKNLLHHSIEAQNFNFVRYLVEHKQFDINATDNSGIRPIHIAAAFGNYEIFIYLVEKGADVYQKSNSGKNLLHFATRGKNINIIKYLVEKTKLDINKSDYERKTPLHTASDSRNAEAFFYLAEKGANIYITNSGQSLLHYAVNPNGWDNYHNKEVREYDNNSAIIEFLIKKGLNVNEIDNTLKTPLNILEDLEGGYGSVNYLVKHDALYLLANNAILNDKNMPTDQSFDITTRESTINFFKNKSINVNSKKNFLNFLLKKEHIEHLKKLTPEDIRFMFSKVVFDCDFFSTTNLSNYLMLGSKGKNIKDKNNNSYYDALEKNPSLIKYSPVGGIFLLRKMNGLLKTAITNNNTIRAFLKNAKNRWFEISSKVENLAQLLEPRQDYFGPDRRFWHCKNKYERYNAIYLKDLKKKIQQGARNLINTIATLYLLSKEESPLRDIPQDLLLLITEFCGMNFGPKLLKTNPDDTLMLDPDKFWNIPTKCSRNKLKRRKLQ